MISLKPIVTRQPQDLFSFIVGLPHIQVGHGRRRYAHFAITTCGLDRHSSMESGSRRGTVPPYPLVSIRVRGQHLRWKSFCHIRHIPGTRCTTPFVILHTSYKNIPAKHKESTEQRTPKQIQSTNTKVGGTGKKEHACFPGSKGKFRFPLPLLLLVPLPSTCFPGSNGTFRSPLLLLLLVPAPSCSSSPLQPPSPQTAPGPPSRPLGASLAPNQFSPVEGVR